MYWAMSQSETIIGSPAVRCSVVAAFAGSLPVHLKVVDAKKGALAGT